MKFICLVLFFVSVSTVAPSAIVPPGICGDKNGVEINGACVFPIMNIKVSHEASIDLCRSHNGELAVLKTREPKLEELIRYEMAPSDYSSFWVDGIYNDSLNKSIQLSDHTTVDLGSSWRYLYPRSSKYRTRVVYDVWRPELDEVEYIQGFRNVPEKVHGCILCQTK